MDEFPDNWCGLWIDEKGKALFIKKCEKLIYKTTIIFDLLNQLQKDLIHINEHLKNLTTNWVFDKQRKINRLQIEVGLNYVGPTYNLYYGLIDNTESKPINSKIDPFKIELLPEVQMGLYDDMEDDYGIPWGFPYFNYRKAPKDIEEKFLKFSSFNDSEN